MIRKPPAGWGEERDATVSAVRASVDIAKGGVRVAKAGGHSVRGFVCWFFAILWGFCALAGGLFGSLPTLIGVGAMAAFMAWSGMRAFRTAGGLLGDEHKIPPIRPASAATGGSMRTISYGDAKLMRAVGFGAIATVGGFWLFPHSHGFMTLVLVVGIPFLLLLAIGSAKTLCGDRVALSWDPHTLTATTLWKRRTVAWSEVSEIGTRTIKTYGFYGLIQTGSNVLLEVRLKAGGKLALTTRLLDLPFGGVQSLVDELATASAGGSTAFVPVPARARPTAMAAVDYPAQDGVFDPDAIIARYLTEKERNAQALASTAPEQQATLRPAPRQFGRKVA